MKGSLVAFGVVTLALAAALATPAARDVSATSPTVACTAQQKKARVVALRKFQRSQRAARTKFFEGHKSPAERARFVRRQQQKLRALRAAAACTVVLPPPEGAPCAPELEGINTPLELEQLTGFFPLHEGTLTPGLTLPSQGMLRVLVLPVDFVDAPAHESAPVVGAAVTSDLRWFADVSAGRMSVTATLLSRWHRMPHPTGTYTDNITPEFAARLLRDATAQADADVDFRSYDFVYVLFPPALRMNFAWLVRPGRGIVRDGTELRHIAVLSEHNPDVARHELLHALGLPDLYVRDAASGTTDHSLVGLWDPMSTSVGSREPLAWHKWRLRWITSAQIACVDDARTTTAYLTAVGRRGGIKMIVARTSASFAYVVEARDESGRDFPIFPQGVLVYTVDASVASGRGAVRVLRPPLPVGGVFEDATLRVDVRRPLTSRTWHVRVTRKR